MRAGQAQRSAQPASTGTEQAEAGASGMLPPVHDTMLLPGQCALLSEPHTQS